MPKSYSHLNPDNPDDRLVIDIEWRKMRARRARRAEVRGWVRVAAHLAAVATLAAGAITLVYLLTILALAAAGTN